MGFMASRAIPRSRLMRLLLFHLCLHIFMTGQTEIGTLCQEEIVQFCLVGAVAFRAVARRQRLVLALGTGQGLLHIVVARKTQDILFGRNHTGHIASVRIVTGEAIAADEGRVVRAALSLLHEVLVALNTEVGTRGPQELLLDSTVRLVAGAAIGLDDRPMSIGLQEFCL